MTARTLMIQGASSSVGKSLLTAALCRAQGIPSRTALGLICIERRGQKPALGFHMGTEVWIAGGPDPNHYVDVTDTFPRKIAALRAHESQIGRMEDLPERLKGRLALMAGQAGLPEGRLAEGFRVLDTA